MVRRGFLDPIKASDVRWDRLARSDAQDLLVPLVGSTVPPVELVSHEPLVVAEPTIKRARACALQLIARQAGLPATHAASELLAMAYTVLHFTKE